MGAATDAPGIFTGGADLGERPPIDPQTPLEGLMDLVQAAHLRCAGPDQAGILVATMHDASDETRHLVVVAAGRPARHPGRRSALNLFPTPQRIHRDRLRAAARADGLARAIGNTMRAAGVAPGDEVVLAGHGLAGAGAAKVAAQGRFNITALLAVGSPIAACPVPRGTAVLAIEHERDPMPALAGAAPVHRENWHTCVVGAAVRGEGHSAAGYHLTSHRLEGSTGNDDMAWWREQMAPFAGTPMQVRAYGLSTDAEGPASLGSEGARPRR